MDPLYEQRLIAEVIYLHSLWHQGPPRPHLPQLQPPPQHHQPATSYFSSSAPLLHHPSNPTQFKKKGKNKHKRNAKNDKPSEEKNPDSGKEWPCNPSSGGPPATTSDWNRAWAKQNAEPLLVSPQEKAKFAANQTQSKALKATRDYFLTFDDDESDDDDDDFMEEEDGYEECEEYGFFYMLFAEDSELREYYNKNYPNGEFVCLVCGGIGKKSAWKKYKGCIALVQHSISIAKTQKKRAHRAYGRAICKTLGWDIDNLARVVSELAENHKLPLNDDNQGHAETFDERNAQAKVGERDQNSLAALESKDGSVDASNLEEGEAQAIVDEGYKNGSAVLEANEGSIGDECNEKGKAEANVGEGTKDKDNSTNLERKEAPVDACNGDALPVEESFSGENSGSNSGSTSFEKNSGIEAEGSKTAGDFGLAVPVVAEGAETKLSNHREFPILKSPQKMFGRPTGKLLKEAWKNFIRETAQDDEIEREMVALLDKRERRAAESSSTRSNRRKYVNRGRKNG